MIDKIIASLKAEYGQVGEMMVGRGKKHNYLRMMLDFSKDGASIVDMKDYLKEMLNNLPKDMTGMATTPTADHLFEVTENAPKIDEDRAEFFHCVVAQMLFVAQNGQLDL